jgi:septal ring factor EnvC (AmiA/AmiB activator)
MLAEKVDQYKRQINEHQELQQGLAAELESTDVSQAAFISRIREINSKWQEAERNIVSMTENNSVEEAISDLKSQHALEVSERDSEARKLADELHEQFTQSHRLAKQVADLESELTALRGGIRVPREKSNVAAMSPRRPTALQSPRGASYTHTPSPIVPSSASIDSTLPPSVRHKRQVSLAMLKARMSGPPPSLSREHGDDRSMHALVEEGQADDADLHYPKTFRSQVSDEAIFWCPECHGDLITL